MATRKIVSKHIAPASSTYVGEDGELFYDTDTNLLKISDGSTPGGVTLNTDGGTSYTPPTTVIRAQRIDGGLASDGTKWTFTTISGSGSATFGTLNTNPSILITLTGFSRMPSVAYQFDNNLEANGGNRDSSYVTSAEINLLESTTSGTGFVSPGSPNIITNFTPSTHKFAVPGTYTTEQDFYFEFRQ